MELLAGAIPAMSRTFLSAETVTLHSSYWLQGRNNSTHEVSARSGWRVDQALIR
jgi:hypothetical protein